MISSEAPGIAEVTGAAVSPVLAGLGMVLVAPALVGAPPVPGVVLADDPPLSDPQAANATANTAGTTKVRQDVAMTGDARTALPIRPVAELHLTTRTTRRVDVREQVEQTIDAIRPALQADGGDIFLRDVDEATGVVSVTLVGACGTCPVSTDTLKAGIERIMRDRVDGVTEVVSV
jgi:Fe-S cluster biogenesis protein NfuA